MIWIHGGDFVGGWAVTAATDGSALAKKGVVFVSISYRLGAFGFLGHPALTKESAHHSLGITDFSTNWRRCSGCGTILSPSVGTPEESRSLDIPRARRALMYSLPLR